MIKQFLFITFAIFQSCVFSQYELVWSDEFDGEELDLEKWTFDIGQGSWGWGNNELQYYTSNSSNVRVQDGMLNITAKEEQYANASYTSTRIKTKDLYQFQYIISFGRAKTWGIMRKKSYFGLNNSVLAFKR